MVLFLYTLLLTLTLRHSVQCRKSVIKLNHFIPKGAPLHHSACHKVSFVQFRRENILMFRELQFPLKEIKVILDSEGFEPNEALEQQINLLELQLKHIKELICFARKIQKGDMKEMEFQAFSKKEINQYAAEAKEKWGSSKAYKEYEKKTRGQTDEEMKQTTEKLLNLFAKIGSLKHLPPTEEQVQQKISALQTFITENYYNCTDDILNGLGKMYVSDERMTCTVDKAGGEGTAKFVKQAISVYVQKA